MGKDWRRILRTAFLDTSATLGIYPMSRAILNWAVVLLAIFFLYLGGQWVLVSDEIAVRKALIWSGSAVFLVVFVFHAGRAYAFAEPQLPLVISYDPSQHKLPRPSGDGVTIRFSVENVGKKTIHNVSLQLTRIAAPDGMPDANIHKFTPTSLNSLEGLPLAVTTDPTIEFRHPGEKPRSSVTIHAGGKQLFDVIQLCRPPGNHIILHSLYQVRAITGNLQQKPNGVVPPADYEIMVTAVGDNATSSPKSFRCMSNGIQEARK